MAAALAHFPLLDLPPEMVEEVALLLGGTDLKNMRMASSACHFHLEKTFRQLCCKHVSVLLCDEQSLQQFGTIAAHPQFGAAVKEITLLIGELPADYRSELVNTTNYNQWVALRAAHDNLKTSGLGAVLLKRALKSFAHHGKLVKVVVEDNTRRALRKGGQTANIIQQLESFGDLSLAPPDPMRNQCFTTTINQIADSGLRFTDLCLFTDIWSILIEEMTETMQRSVMASQRFKDRLHRTLLDVEALFLPVRPDKNTTGRFIYGFFERIAKAPSLQHLGIRIHNGSNARRAADKSYYYPKNVVEAGQISPALLAQTFPKLRTLAVCSCDNWSSYIQLEDLKSFVRRHKDLNLLKLRQIRVKGLDYVRSEDGQKLLGPLLGIRVSMEDIYNYR